jgi:hypothetical protein
MAHGLSSKLNDLCRSVSLSVHCDKRKEKDRLFVGEGRCSWCSMIEAAVVGAARELALPFAEKAGTWE